MSVEFYSNGCVLLQFGISDEDAHESAKKILLRMGEYFQIQVNTCTLYIL